LRAGSRRVRLVFFFAPFFSFSGSFLGGGGSSLSLETFFLFSTVTALKYSPLKAAFFLSTRIFSTTFSCFSPSLSFASSTFPPPSYLGPCSHFFLFSSQASQPFLRMQCFTSLSFLPARLQPTKLLGLFRFFFCVSSFLLFADSKD